MTPPTRPQPNYEHLERYEPGVEPVEPRDVRVPLVLLAGLVAVLVVAWLVLR